MIILSHNMSLHDLDTFIDQELGTIGLGGCSPVPLARTGTAGLLCRLQGCFGIGMGNPSAGVFGLSYRPTRHKTRLIVLARPNVIRYLGYRRDKENGVMGVHGSKDKISMCQTAAASTVHVHRAGEWTSNKTWNGWQYNYCLHDDECDWIGPINDTDFYECWIYWFVPDGNSIRFW